MTKVTTKFIDGSSYTKKFDDEKAARHYSTTSRIHGITVTKKGWFKNFETFHPVNSILSITIEKKR